MSTDSTGNNGPLSFADKLSFSERKRLKCFPAMMHIEQIATLEHPDSLERQKTLALALIDACERGELPSIPDQQYDDGWIEDGLVFGWWHKTLELCEGPTPIISREAYQAWRAQYPARLLPDLSHIGAWLGATPATESIPPIETSLPKPARPASPARKPGPARLTEAQQDKQDCQAIALELWAEQPNANQATLLKNPRIKPYVNKWKGEKTVSRWLSKVDPREKERRRGRPKTR